MEKLIKETETGILWAIDNIIQLARKIETGDPQKVLKDESLSYIMKVLWEAPKITHLKEAAWLSGYLTSLFDMKEAVGIKLNSKIEVYKAWEKALASNG